MLILLDNAATPEQIVPLLPGGDSCTVLITSRHRLPTLLARHGAYPIHLDVLDDAEARTLLATAIGDGTRDAQSAMTELIGLCRGFPLALGVIAARIRTHPNLLEDIVTELRDLGLRALESDDADVSLPTVLSWSLRHLTDQQRTLFGLLGIAPGPDIALPAVAALTALPSTAARKALSALEEASLLHRRPHGRYGMHDLVRDYAATTAQFLSCDVREAALVRVVDFHLHTAHHASHLLEPYGQFLQPSPPAPGVNPHPLPNAAAASTWLDAEHASLLSSQRAAVALGRHHVVWHLAWALDTYHARRRHLRDSLAAWRNALDAAAHLSDPTTRIHAYRLLGRVCARLGLHDEATGHLNRALGLAERHHDPTQQAFAHRALALAWGRQGDDQRALDHARHALDLFRTLDRPTWEADALTSVGWYAARLGNFHTARDHCRAALTLNRHHRDVEGEAITLDKLGLIAHRTGDHAQAVDHYHQSLALFRTLSHTSQVPNILDSVGHPLVAVGHHDRARKAWSEALELYREQGRDSDAQRVQQQLDDLEALTGIDSGRT
jgi:tetratricopeptide (TPR) repeat protein